MVSTMNAIIRWLACLPIVVLGKLITIVCAPVAAYLSMRGDALPRPLRWMQTHDNPLDALWQRQLRAQPWLTNRLPETLGSSMQTLAALIREYLFVSLFRACAESLASENASRLATMQRAEKNIGEMLDALKHSYHQLRQEGIDAELFDIVAGFEGQM